MKCRNWIKRAISKLKNKNRNKIVNKLFYMKTKELKSSLSPVEKEIVDVVRRHDVMKNKCMH